MFDFDKPWNFEAELMTDLKVAYVLEQNQACAVPAEFDAATQFYGEDIRRAYEILGSDFSVDYDIYGCAARFLTIKEEIGWEPFKQTFYDLLENEKVYTGATGQEKFETFVERLSYYSGKDIKGYFTNDEWNTIFSKGCM